METEQRRRHGRHFLIPAGILIGLGIGLLVGYPGPGILIGLGFGLLASAFERPDERVSPDPGASSPAWGGPHWISIIIGIFIILLGIGLIWAPLNIWPYVLAIFLIMIGIWFIARGYGRRR
jgi:hypothetical protein